MAVTGQRTTQNSKADAEAKKRSEASKKAARTRKANAAKAKRAGVSTASKGGKAKAIREDNPFFDEEVEVYNPLEAEVERREGRAPIADPVAKVKVGKDGVLKIEGVRKGAYYVYSPASGQYLQVFAK